MPFFTLFALLAPLLAALFLDFGARLRPALSGRARVAPVLRPSFASGTRVLARLVGLLPFGPRLGDRDGSFARAVLRVIRASRVAVRSAGALLSIAVIFLVAPLFSVS
jgi:hypothetical protein